MDQLLVIIAIICGSLGLLSVLVTIIVRFTYQKKTINETLQDPVVLQISVPTHNEKSPLAAEQFFQSLHGIVRNDSKAQDHYSFEIVAAPKGIYFLVVCAPRYRQFVKNQIYAQYPQAQIKVIKDYTSFETKTKQVFTSTELALKTDYYLPIKTFVSFEVDPLASITGAISKLSPGYEAWIQVVVRPIDNSWQKKVNL